MATSLNNPADAEAAAMAAEAHAHMILRMIDSAIETADAREKKKWERYLATPSEGQIAFYRSDDFGIIKFDMDSTFEAEQILVHAKRRQDETIASDFSLTGAGAALGGRVWMKIEDVASGRVFTEGKQPNLKQFDDTRSMNSNGLVPAAPWCPVLREYPQFDYVARLAFQHDVQRASAFQFSFWINDSFELDPSSSAQPIYFPVTLIGRKVFG